MVPIPLLADVEVAVNDGNVRVEYTVDPVLAKFPTPCTPSTILGVVVPRPVLPVTIRSVEVVMLFPMEVANTDPPTPKTAPKMSATMVRDELLICRRDFFCICIVLKYIREYRFKMKRSDAYAVRQ